VDNQQYQGNLIASLTATVARMVPKNSGAITA